MKTSIDKELCTGCELCVQTCPEVYEMQGDIAVAKAEVVPPGNEDCAKQAAEDCPTVAIKIEE